MTMSDDVYHRLARVLDTLPNGFPATESNVEIKLLKKVFTPEEADLFCDLRLEFETAAQIAERTGRPLEGLEEMLTSMRDRGEIMGVDFSNANRFKMILWVFFGNLNHFKTIPQILLGNMKLFKMVPWVLGIYEYQVKRMDRDFAALSEEYFPYFGKQFFEKKPQYMQVIPIDRDLSARHESLAYEEVSRIIEKGRSFALAECICKKEKGLLDHPCDKPVEVCLAIAPLPGLLDDFTHWGRPVSKTEAYDVLKKAEAAGLVHLTHNVANNHFFICNCCGCCCGILRGINELGIQAPVYTNFYAEIDADSCTLCGTCADDRCQVNALKEGKDAYRVIREQCIGCGLCISTCPADAIRLFRKRPEEIVAPPRDEDDWMEMRARNRGVDYSIHK